MNHISSEALALRTFGNTKIGAFVIGALSGAVGGLAGGLVRSASVSETALNAVIYALGLGAAMFASRFPSRLWQKALAFGLAGGIVGASVGFFLLAPDKSFIRYAGPIIFGAVCGGFPWVYMFESMREGN